MAGDLLADEAGENTPMNDLQGFYGPNAGYVLDLYDRFLRDPSAVDPETRAVFERWSPDGGSENGVVGRPATETSGESGVTFDMDRAANISWLARTIRSRGHMAARL